MSKSFDIEHYTDYLFVAKERDEIVEMKVLFKNSSWVNVIRNSEAEDFKEVSVEDFNNLKLSYVGTI